MALLYIPAALAPAPGTCAAIAMAAPIGLNKKEASSLCMCDLAQHANDVSTGAAAGAPPPFFTTGRSTAHTNPPNQPAWTIT